MMTTTMRMPARETDLLCDLRRRHEMLVSSCQQYRFEAVVELGSGRVFGYSPLPDDRLGSPGDARAAPAADSRTCRRMPGASSGWALSNNRPNWRVTCGGLLARRCGGTGRGGTGRFPREPPQPAGRSGAVGHRVALQCRDRGVASGRRGGPTAATRRSGGPAGLHRPARTTLRRSPRCPGNYVILADSLVWHLPRSVEHQELVQTVVSIGREREWIVVATGIRTAEEQRWCQKLGCAFGQGPCSQRPHNGQAGTGRTKVRQTAGNG